MKIELGNYKIESDAYNFIVKRVDNSEVKNDKGEIVGTKEVEKVVGYTSNFDKALKLVTNSVLLDNDDIKEICKILKTISIKISGIKMQLDRITEIKGEE